MTDGRNFEKYRNHISAMVGPIDKKFGTETPFDSLNLTGH